MFIDSKAANGGACVQANIPDTLSRHVVGLDQVPSQPTREPDTNRTQRSAFGVSDGTGFTAIFLSFVILTLDGFGALSFELMPGLL